VLGGVQVVYPTGRTTWFVLHTLPSPAHDHDGEANFLHDILLHAVAYCRGYDWHGASRLNVESALTALAAWAPGQVDLSKTFISGALSNVMYDARGKVDVL